AELVGDPSGLPHGVLVYLWARDRGDDDALRGPVRRPRDADGELLARVGRLGDQEVAQLAEHLVPLHEIALQSGLRQVVGGEVRVAVAGAEGTGVGVEGGRPQRLD